jgi:hypothetical protein
VAAQIEVQVPLGARTPDRFLAWGAPLPAAFTRPGTIAAPTGTVAGTPITAAHVRDLLTQLDAAGLHTPPGDSLRFSFVDARGALQAVATLRELRQAGCSRPGAVSTRPAVAAARSSTGPSRPTPTSPLPRSGGSCTPATAAAGIRAATTAPAGRMPTTSSPTHEAGPPTAPTSAACAADTTGSRPSRPAGPT